MGFSAAAAGAAVFATLALLTGVEWWQIGWYSDRAIPAAGLNGIFVGLTIVCVVRAVEVERQRRRDSVARARRLAAEREARIQSREK